jgi:hypothetical protein
MLTHQTTFYGLLGTLALGTFLAFPYGFGVAAIPVVLYAALTAIAAMFIPNSPTFREAVDRRFRAIKREAAREHFLGEISERIDQDARNWPPYKRMRERLESLAEIAKNQHTALSMRDIEKLDDATVNFLGLWLAKLTMADRARTIDDDQVGRRLSFIESQLKKDPDSPDRARLLQAKQDYEQVRLRRERLTSKEVQVDAAMLSMTDSFDELYQSIMTNPTSGDLNRHLQHAVERIAIEDELGSAIDEELDDLLPRRRAAAAKAKQKAM